MNGETAAYLAVLVFGIGWMCAAGADVLRVLLQLVLSQEIHLGTDGIRWGKGPWRKFLAFHDIAHMRLKKNAMEFVTKDGASHRIRLQGMFDGAAQSIRARLQGALDSESALLMPELSRDGRSDEEWRDALRALVKHRDEYRRAPVPRERVREILQNSAASPEQRLGAAVALVEAEDAKGLRILSDVSDATANPELAPAFRELAAEAEAILAEEQAEEAAYLDG